MRFIPLASSSAGNAYIVEEPGGGRLLLECGLTYKRLTRLAGGRLGGLCGCLITHEHGDHAKCWRELLKSGVRVWASAGTREALGGELLEALPEGEGPLRPSPLRPFGPPPPEGEVKGHADGAGAEGHNPQSGLAASQPLLKKGPEGRLAGRYLPFSVGPFEVLPFSVYHDSAEPVGFLIRAGEEKLAFATDTAVIHSRFPGVNILALEANYDAAILARCERMPDKVKHRVRNSHMEIGDLCRYLQGADLSRCREIWLLHLSSAAANEGDFVRRVREAVPPGIRVTACPEIGGG